MKKNKNRKGLWIPKELLENPELDCTNKMLLSEIHSLHELEKGCFAPNEFFSDLLGMTKSAASKRITRLKNLGYITTKNIYEKGNCIGRVIVPTFKKFNSEIRPESNKGSSPKNQVVVPEQLNGSSQTTLEVVPEIPDGSSITNTINTTTNSKELIQVTNTDAGDVSELFLTDSTKIESKTSIQKARSAYNEWFDDYPNWESDLLLLGIEEFIRRTTKYHSNRSEEIAMIRWYATL